MNLVMQMLNLRLETICNNNNCIVFFSFLLLKFRNQFSNSLKQMDNLSKNLTVEIPLKVIQ